MSDDVIGGEMSREVAHYRGRLGAWIEAHEALAARLREREASEDALRIAVGTYLGALERGERGALRVFVAAVGWWGGTVPDEAEVLRAEATRLTDTLGAVGHAVGAESCERDVLLAAVAAAIEAARREGAEVMRGAAAAEVGRFCMIHGDQAREHIRALSLPTEGVPRG